MSTSEIVVPDDTYGNFSLGVTALDQLPRKLPRWALVGANAVNARLGTVHRATQDLDSVSANRQAAVDLLLERGASRQGRELHLPGGVRFDVIELVPQGTEANPLQLARRWALETAEPVQLAVRGPDGDIVARAEVLLATAPALVAMKAQSLEVRKTADKRVNDGYDLIRLTEHIRPAELVAGFRRAPEALQHATIQSLRTRFDIHGDVTAIRMTSLRSRFAHLADVTPDRVLQVATVAGTLEKALGRSPPRPPLRTQPTVRGRSLGGPGYP